MTDYSEQLPDREKVRKCARKLLDAMGYTLSHLEAF